MKTLILCRHAKSDWPEGVSDIHRPLKERGIQDANYLGQLLKAQDFRPDLMLSSPARRAQQTASIFQNQLDYSSSIDIRPEIYHQGVRSMTELISGLPDDKEQTFIFGHNPTVSDVAGHYLLMNGPYSMPTCGMICMETMANSWRAFIPGNVYLRWLLVPRFQRQGQD